MTISRRTFFGILAAPAIVPFSSLMPIRGEVLSTSNLCARTCEEVTAFLEQYMRDAYEQAYKHAAHALYGDGILASWDRTYKLQKIAAPMLFRQA